MTETVEPLTPPECDLRDFAFMPLDVLRLRDSDLAAIPDAEAFRAAVLSWCVAWHQVPAGSLPADDATLCRLLGYGRDVKGWLRVRAAGALRGYVLCSDGRLYHPVVAEKAHEAWRAKIAQRERTAAARAARQRQKEKGPDTDGGGSAPQRQSHSLSQSDEASVTDDVTGSKGQGQGQGQGDSEELPSVALPARAAPRTSPMTGFAEFWPYWPKKVARGEAEKAWPAAVRAAGGDPGVIIDGLKCRLHIEALFPTKDGGQFIPNPATWLRRRGWEDAIPGVADPGPEQSPLFRH